MTLRDYLRRPGNTGRRLASEVGVSPSTVSRWAAGLTMPCRPMMAAITRATGGLVRARDFYDDRVPWEAQIV